MEGWMDGQMDILKDDGQIGILRHLNWFLKDEWVRLE